MKQSDINARCAASFAGLANDAIRNLAAGRPNVAGDYVAWLEGATILAASLGVTDARIRADRVIAALRPLVS